MSKKIGFVILHYCTYEMTIECVKTIQDKMKGHMYHVTIVDNASDNQTGAALAEYYKDTPDVHVILNQENLGFANGNNVGYAYERNVVQSEFICVMNNDVLLLQGDFGDIIEKEYAKSQFAVMGPHIELKGGRENAMYYQIASVETLKKEMRTYERRLKHLKSVMFPIWDMYDKLMRVTRIFLGKIHIMPPMEIHEEMVEGAYDRHEDMILHGCCVIFSPLYIQKFENAFETDTFMFREEELLFLRCKKEGLLMQYAPQARILHLEDVATNYIHKTNKVKEIFHLENQVQSLKILIQKLEE